jgi:hypothetical protein
VSDSPAPAVVYRHHRRHRHYRHHRHH